MVSSSSGERQQVNEVSQLLMVAEISLLLDLWVDAVEYASLMLRK